MDKDRYAEAKEHMDGIAGCSCFVVVVILAIFVIGILSCVL